MADYRLYHLDGTGQINTAAELLQAADDESAITVARDRRTTGACELWQGRRLVARLPEPQA